MLRVKVIMAVRKCSEVMSLRVRDESQDEGSKRFTAEGKRGESMTAGAEGHG